MAETGDAIDIRRCRAGDEPLFGSVADDVFDYPVGDTDALARYLADPRLHLIVAIDGRRSSDR